MRQQQHPVTAILLAFLCFLGINLVVSLGLKGCRLDLTANHMYTLSEGTEEVLQNLEEPIDLTLYWTEKNAEDVPQIRTYAQRVREFLQDLSALADGKLRLHVVDPEPFSEAEDEAELAGITPLSLGGGRTVSLGLVARNSVDETDAIPFLDPSKESFLEYDVVRLIHALSLSEKQKIALVSGMALAEDANPRSTMPGMPPMPGKPWQVMAQMEELYEVESVDTDAESLPEDADAVVVVFPYDLSEGLQHALDAWALEGKPLMVFLDPHNEVEAQRAASKTNSGMPSMGPMPSDFGNLLSSWGVEWHDKDFVADRQWAQRVSLGAGGRNGVETLDYLAWLAVGKESLAADDPITGVMEQINLNSAGWFSVAEDSDLQLNPLVESSDQAALMPVAKIASFPDPASLLRDFHPTGKKYPLVVRVSGTLHSAFDKEKTATAGTLILVGDTDFLNDSLWIRQETLGPIFLGYRRFADNGPFVLNALELLTGSSSLGKLRGRGSAQRPFARVRVLRQEAEARYLQREQELQEEIRQGEQRLREMQNGSGEGLSNLILSPEQEAEVEKLQQTILDARKELREVQHNLQKDIEALGQKVMLWNVLGTPLAAALLVLALAWWRGRRRPQIGS